MSSKTPKRVRGHQPAMGETVDVVHYRVRNLPSKAVKEGEASAFAEVIPKGSMSLGELLTRIDRENLGMKPNHTKMVVEVLLNTIVAALREGRHVTIGNFLTFGTSIKGRVDPTNPKVSGKLELRPWVRCSTTMIDDLNRGAKFLRVTRE